MTTAFKCDNCGEYMDGKVPIYVEVSVRVTEPEAHGESDSPDFCSRDCALEYDYQGAFERTLDEVDEELERREER